MKHSNHISRQLHKHRKAYRILGKIASIGLLLTGLYLYGVLTRHTGYLAFGSGTPQLKTSAVVHYIDVGQADAACIVTPDGHTVLIDAGSNLSQEHLISYLAKYCIREIDYAVFTHPHEDHIGGADRVFDFCRVGHVILPDAAASTATYDMLLTSMQNEGCTVEYALPGNSYSLGDASLTILGPACDYEDNGNNASVILRFDYGDTSFLFTGDAEASAEAAVILENKEALNADVLKVAHHGSATSSTDAFLSAVTPTLAIISCGPYNEFGHPHSSVLDRLSSHTPHIFRTDESGSIRVYTDGTALLVQSDRMPQQE